MTRFAVLAAATVFFSIGAIAEDEPASFLGDNYCLVERAAGLELDFDDDPSAFTWANAPKSLRVIVTSCADETDNPACDNVPGISWVPRLTLSGSEVTTVFAPSLWGGFVTAYPPQILRLNNDLSLRYVSEGQTTDNSEGLFVIEAQCFKPD